MKKTSKVIAATVLFVCLFFALLNIVTVKSESQGITAPPGEGFTGTKVYTDDGVDCQGRPLNCPI